MSSKGLAEWVKKVFANIQDFIYADIEGGSGWVWKGPKMGWRSIWMVHGPLGKHIVSFVQPEPHWDLLPKVLSLDYYSTLEGVLGVQRSGQAQGTIICLFSSLFFSQNGMKFTKPTKIIKIQ